MTDRGRAALRRDRDRLQVGPSQMRWTGKELVIDIDEWGAPPMVGKLRGQIVLTPQALTGVEAALTPDGRHRWRPFAPISHISVRLGRGHDWDGHGYFDANFGSRALEKDFSFWTWGRFPQKSRTVCFYDAVRRDGSQLDLAVQVLPDGQVTQIAAPPLTSFRRSNWLLRRETRIDPGSKARQILSLLDAPFYSRALVESRIDGEPTIGMHEALDLDRFRWRWLMPMLALRVPRRGGWPQTVSNPADLDARR